MLEEQYKRAFNSIVPSPQLVGRTERSIEDMMNGKKVRKITLRAALAVALILAVLTAVGYAAVHSLLLEGLRLIYEKNRKQKFPGKIRET